MIEPRYAMKDTPTGPKTFMRGIVIHRFPADNLPTLDAFFGSQVDDNGLMGQASVQLCAGPPPYLLFTKPPASDSKELCRIPALAVPDLDPTSRQLCEELLRGKPGVAQYRLEDGYAQAYLYLLAADPSSPETAITPADSSSPEGNRNASAS